MIKTDYSAVERSLKAKLNLSKDFRSVFLEIIGEIGDRREWTVIGSIQRNFIGQRSPEGDKWDDLSSDYAKRKNKIYPNRSILIANANLFNSLVYGGAGNVSNITPKSFTFGTVIPYGAYHMTGTKKMPARPFLGFSRDQIKVIKDLIKKSVKEAS